jgi:hypothetical protein
MNWKLNAVNAQLITIVGRSETVGEDDFFRLLPSSAHSHRDHTFIGQYCLPVVLSIFCFLNIMRN